MAPPIVSDELRRMAEAEHVVSFPANGAARELPITKDGGLDEVIRLYRGLPERQREKLLAVFRAAADALSRQIDEENSCGARYGETPGERSRAGDATMCSREARAVAARSGTPPTHGLTPMRAQLARLTRREVRAAPLSEG